MTRRDDDEDYDDGCCTGCGCWPCDCDSDDDLDIDVCQNCGGYFAWTPELTATWREHWHTTENDTQPQRCSRCLRDECWVEDRDAG